MLRCFLAGEESPSLLELQLALAQLSVLQPLCGYPTPADARSATLLGLIASCLMCGSEVRRGPQTPKHNP